MYICTVSNFLYVEASFWWLWPSKSSVGADLCCCRSRFFQLESVFFKELLCFCWEFFGGLESTFFLVEADFFLWLKPGPMLCMIGVYTEGIKQNLMLKLQELRNLGMLCCKSYRMIGNRVGESNSPGFYNVCVQQFM